MSLFYIWCVVPARFFRPVVSSIVNVSLSFAATTAVVVVVVVAVTVFKAPPNQGEK